MIQVGEILGFGLQGRLHRERGASTTRLLELLREKMDTGDRMVRRKTLSERLGLKGISCCGATWSLRTNNIIVRRDDDDNGEEGREGAQAPETEIIDVVQRAPESGTTQACLGQIPSASGMNLAAALAAERNFRAGQDSYGSRADSSPRPISPDIIQGMNHGSTGPKQGTPFRVSLMKLLEETDGSDAVIEKEGGGGVGCDSMCCVCMVRKKGAAFIPCGHTYCRVCSRELWLNRGFCPLCNRSIIEILDIF